MTRPKRVFDSEETVLTFAYLKKAAEHALAMGTANAEGSFYSFLQALMCSAFTLEAYLNHLGDLQFSYWTKVERSLSPQQKLIMICDKLGFGPVIGERPYSSFRMLFEFRNAIAHGRTETVTEQIVLGEAEPRLPWAQTKWQKLCEASGAKRASMIPWL